MRARAREHIDKASEAFMFHAIERGNRPSVRQNNEGWGAQVVDRLSVDLHDAFPEMRASRRET